MQFLVGVSLKWYESILSVACDKPYATCMITSTPLQAGSQSPWGRCLKTTQVYAGTSLNLEKCLS